MKIGYLFIGLILGFVGFLFIAALARASGIGCLIGGPIALIGLIFIILSFKSDHGPQVLPNLKPCTVCGRYMDYYAPICQWCGYDFRHDYSELPLPPPQPPYHAPSYAAPYYPRPPTYPPPAPHPPADPPPFYPPRAYSQYPYHPYWPPQEPPKILTCKKCGKQMEPGWKLCPYCGHKRRKKGKKAKKVKDKK